MKIKIELNSHPTHPQGYLNRLVWMCFRGFQKTSSVMRSIPVASQLLNSVSPKCLGELEGFVEALLLEMVSNRVGQQVFWQRLGVFCINYLHTYLCLRAFDKKIP